MNKALKPLTDWMSLQGWKPLEFQIDVWERYLEHKSGIIQVPTGSGKTYAAFFGPLAELIENPRKGLKVLYITPLRAVSRDIEKSLKKPIEDLKLKLKVESRTGDTSYYRRRKQMEKPPDILITTPESLSIMFSFPENSKYFEHLECVIVDEWHELLHTKRGTQTELCLSHLRSIRNFRTWVMSATIGNIEEAARTAFGAEPYELITSNIEREINIDTILPQSVDTFPWAGHLGLFLFDQLMEKLDEDVSTLLFCNTRSQAEKWFQAISDEKPHMEHQIALHHSSISRKDREKIEEGLKSGDIKWVVATSSLDLGVDFSPVKEVVQIGSAKGIARMIQRAGRSHHNPGEMSQIVFVPTHALELFEVAALRRAMENHAIEKRVPLYKPYDVLAQHLVTLACGDGFSKTAIYEEVTKTYSYRDLTHEELDWILEFIEYGGKTLVAYPQYQKVRKENDTYFVSHALIAKFHRMSIGTIASQSQVYVQYRKGKSIGSVEEIFASKLKKGDVFFFAGRKLEFLHMRDMKVIVQLTSRTPKLIPSWDGGRLPMSTPLSYFLREELGEANTSSTPREREKLIPIIDSQNQISQIPGPDEILIEHLDSKEGSHLFVFPFEGRMVHEGLANLWSLRFARRAHSTFSIAMNDYGLEILGPKGYKFSDYFDDDFFATDDLESEIEESINLSELTKRQFREIAQVAGLVFAGYPSAGKSTKQIQMSSSLLFDVFKRYDPENLLLKQARREVLYTVLEANRMRNALTRFSNLKVVWKETDRPSPLAFPLIVEHLGGRLSNESLHDRVERIKKSWTA